MLRFPSGKRRLRTAAGVLAGIALAAWAFPAHAQLPRLEWGGGTPVDFSFADPNTRSAAQTVRYINAGAVPATLGAMAASDEFVIAPGSTCAPGQTLAPQASCTLLLQFAPVTEAPGAA